MKTILDREFKYRDSVKGHTPEAFAKRMRAYGRIVKREHAKAAKDRAAAVVRESWRVVSTDPFVSITSTVDKTKAAK